MSRTLSLLAVALALPIATQNTAAQQPVFEKPAPQPAPLKAPTPVIPAGLRCTLYQPPRSEAFQALNSGDPARAQQLFTTQLATQPTPTTYIGLVDSQLAQQDFTAALETAHRAAAAFPASGNALALTGDALFRAGLIQQASDAYASALAKDQCAYRAHLGIARINALSGHNATAMRSFSFAHRLAPADAATTAAYLEALPPASRGPALRSFLSETPTLPPAQLATLTTQSAILNSGNLCRPETPVTQASFELLPIYLTGRFVRSWGLKTTIDGEDMPLLEVDTSAPGIVLNPADAARAKVQPVNTATPDAPYAAIAGRIRIGSVTWLGCPVTVVPAAALAGANSLIGTSFFRDNLIRIDYPAYALSLSPLPEPLVTGPFGLTDPPPPAEAQAQWSPALVAGHQLLIPTLVNKKGPFLFALDTGVENSIYSPAMTQAELDQSRDATINLRGTSASIVKVIPKEGGVRDYPIIHGAEGQLLKVSRPVKFPTLRYAFSEIADPSAVTFDLTPVSRQAHTEVSGLLGFQQLSYFIIQLNYRDARVSLVFDQNRRYHVTQAEQRY